jgi:hypothetical protein
MANKVCASACDSKASGNACSNDVDNRMPTDRLTIRSTTFDNSENENSAAAEMLTTPAMVVANRIDSRVELILGPGNMQQSCKLEHSHGFSATTTRRRFEGYLLTGTTLDMLRSQ